LKTIIIKPDLICNINYLAGRPQRLEKPDIVVVFSNGGFGGIHGKLLERLGRR
jgi:hypothetical protein